MNEVLADAKQHDENILNESDLSTIVEEDGVWQEGVELVPYTPLTESNTISHDNFNGYFLIFYLDFFFITCFV